MTETTIATNKVKSAKSNAASFGVSNYEIQNFDLPKMELPEAFREMAEKGIAQAKDSCEKVKSVAEEATGLLKDTYTTASKGAIDYNLKVIEIARTNTNTAIDYAHALLGVKSLSEFVELSTAQTRKQFEAMTAQTKDLTELVQKVTTESAESLKTGISKAFNNKLAW